MDTFPQKVCCVITRYNEYIDWIDYIQYHVDTFYIYNKGTNDLLFKTFVPPVTMKIIVIKLPNIGRIDHTICYHILHNWECLYDITMFLPASILMCYVKGSYLNALKKKLPILSRFNGFYSPRFHKVSQNYNYTIDNYQAEGLCNRNNNPFIKSEYADFQEWKKAVIDDRPMRYIGMRGMFLVARENILHIDKSIFERLLVSLSVGDNIENGHFAERIWAHLFRQYSFDTVVTSGTPVTQEVTPVVTEQVTPVTEPVTQAV
jgi:hypothetical protein